MNSDLKIASFGEVMLRLSCYKYDRIDQVNRLNCSVAGSEANVAVNLSNWGEYSKFLTVLANNEIGNKCMNEIRRFGVNVSSILRNEGRMGLMFLENGAGFRASNIIYYRSNTAISQTKLDAEYFEKSFNEYNWLQAVPAQWDGDY